MAEAAGETACASDGCGHPQAEHVHDRVMHAGAWRDVKRCVRCEHEGGPCTDTAAILSEDEAQEA